MALIHVSGPAHLYVMIVSTGTDNLFPYLYPQKSQIKYLGTCETSVTIQLMPYYKPIFADVAGGDEGAPLVFVLVVL